MATNSRLPEGQINILSTLDAGIKTLDSAEEASGITPAKAAFGSVSALLRNIRKSAVHERDYIELGLNCAEICGALDRGTRGQRTEDFSQSVGEAISHLTTTVAEIQRKVMEQSKRNPASDDKVMISAWKSALSKILKTFNTELAIDTNLKISDTRKIVSDIHRVMVEHQGSDGANLPAQTSVCGESPPPPPRTCFGRQDLIEKVVSLAERLKPVALIGAGGIGKTSIALTVLHNDRIKERFGGDRRFIRCDKFPASSSNLLNKLSKVIGAAIENPEDLAPLRPFLSSREMILFLDNAESILDPQGTDAREIYAVVEELSRFPNICLGIASRISIIPPHFECPTISTLSAESACNLFYSIYNNGGRSEVISNLVKQLDFHALSITLLATTAFHNRWNYDELAKEWDTHRSQALHTDYESLAATIELSLASPSFRNLGPHARDLLGVVAFFPQGIDKNNLDWLFPTIRDRKNIFDKFCVLSLTSRTNNFITMLAPIRDHLRPRDPKSSPLLCAARDHYFSRLSVKVDPDAPGFEEARWIVSEDMNIECLLDVFTSLDMDSEVLWGICVYFMEHLYWHKRRYTVLGSKIERLVDGHPSKPRCLIGLSRLYYMLGNYGEQKRVVIHALELARKQENEFQVAQALVFLSRANLFLGLHKEGIQQTKEALGILERLGDTVGEARCWNDLAELFHLDGQLDAAEQAATHSVALLESGQEFRVCRSHQILGRICRSKGEREKAILHFGEALRIASAFEWHSQIFWVHYLLAELFAGEDDFKNAHDHIDQAKSHALDDAYNLGCAMESKARIWYRQRRFEYVVPEALDALEIFGKLGASKGIATCRNLLQEVEREIAGKLLKSMLPIPVDSPSSACGAPASGSTNPAPIH
ncbi:hypothetical protein BJ322DRAFT_1113202 [Thelephora terrestris]|uniref:NB-ARC domain-containing protein n=1 Tax=Thelephora terrestris TaxID=56493 RepID=A0A9P6H693_9AGAM|nr:hypothetical protein BJ322DRAFT_1113202 [Thelephora terrestris]